MEKETINLLIGGGIAIFSSLFTAIATFIFQNIALNKKRDWEKEDRINNKRNIVISSRLDQIEQEGLRIIEWVNNIFLQYPNYELNGFQNEDLSNLIPEFLRNTNLVPLTIIIGDKPIEDSVVRFADDYISFINWLTERLKSKERLEFVLLENNYKKLRTDFIFVIKYLDKYRIEKLA